MALTKVTGSVIKDSVSLSGNVSVGGTLTYQDVTNVDALGIVTARSGINISSGSLTIPDSIIHSGDTNTKIRFPEADAVTIETNGSERFRITSSGQFGFGTNSPFQYGIATFNSTSGIVLEGSSQSRLLFRHTGGGSNLKLMDIQASSHVMRFRHLDDNTTATIRFIINADGHVVPGTDSQYDLGLTGTRWRNVYADTLYGDGSNLTSLPSQVSITNNANDRIFTGGGGTNLIGESGLTFNGNNLAINASSDDGRVSIVGHEGYGARLSLIADQGDDHIDQWNIRSVASNNTLTIDQFGGGTFNTRLTIASDANNGDVTVNTGNLIIGTSGKGIDFGATANGGTGTPNEIFDDYEEGTWTPAIEGLSNTPSFHNLGGNYTKIGNRVFLQCHIQINGSNKPQFSNQSAAFKISGLPFSGSGIAGGGYFGAHGVCVWQQLQWVGSSYSSYGHNDDTQLSPGIVDGGTRISLQTCGQGIYYTGQLLNRALHNNYAPNIEFDMSYRTAT